MTGCYGDERDYGAGGISVGVGFSVGVGTVGVSDGDGLGDREGLDSGLAEMIGSGLGSKDVSVVAVGEGAGVDSGVGEGVGVGLKLSVGLMLAGIVAEPHSPGRSFTNPAATSCAIKHPAFPC